MLTGDLVELREPLVVADGLRSPGMRGVRGGAENVDVSAGVVDGGEDVLALSDESDGFDEVDRQDRLGLGRRRSAQVRVVRCGLGRRPRS
jgi:hypothetical protein